MRTDIELALIHDGQYWIGRNDTLSAKGKTLAELDEDIKRTLHASANFPQGYRVTIFMGFDFDTLPAWLRQYHAHYFNRRITIEL